MKVTSIDAVDLVFDQIKSGTLASTISGKIYKHSRPLNARTEDVVINSLPINYEQIQKGIINVNIHVPNRKLKIDGLQDETQPDISRLSLLTTYAINELDNKYLGDYFFYVQQDNTHSEPESLSHYQNIRIEFHSINI